jgi:hypothetical protein
VEKDKRKNDGLEERRKCKWWKKRGKGKMG